MSLQPIRLFGDPVLRTPAAPIPSGQDDLAAAEEVGQQGGERFARADKER